MSPLRRGGMVRVCQESQCQLFFDPVGVPCCATAAALPSEIQTHGCHPGLDTFRDRHHPPLPNVDSPSQADD